MMDDNGKKQLYRLIKDMDSKNEVVHLDLANNSIKYNEKQVLLHEKIEELTDEELVRSYIVTKLVKVMGYHERHCVELEKMYTIGRPPKEGAKIDILVTKKGSPFAIFELKAPEKYESEMEGAIKEQLFKVAPGIDAGKNTLRYLVYYTVHISEDNELRERLVTIDFTSYKTYEDWEEASKPNLMSIPKEYGIVRKPVFIKNGKPDLRKDVTRDELDRIRWNIHNILWAGGKYHIELFYNLMGILLAKIYDEKETEDEKAYDFQIFYKNGEPESPEKVYERINRLYRMAVKEYLGYSEEELRRIRDIVFDPPKVKYVTEILQDISLTTNRYDVLGDFFEKIVRTEFKESKGQYLTHTNLVNFMIRAIRLEDLAISRINKEKKLPYIIDPACGSGTFLIESMKLITPYIMANQDMLKRSASVREFVEMMFPRGRRNAWANWYVYGIDINTDLATATKVNMVGHGDGHANIEAKDALIDFEQYSKDRLQVKKASEIYRKFVNEQFDVLFSNPPFSITIDRDTAKKLPKVFVWGEKIASRLEKQKKKKEVSTENLFIERWYQLLKPEGRLGVVLPESVFDTMENEYIRLFLYKYFEIKAIVSLPDIAFQPYTPTKTSLLFAQKKSPEEVMRYEELWGKYEKLYDLLRREIYGVLDRIDGISVTEIEGIGRKRNERLKNAGISTIRQFVSTPKEKLAEFMDLDSAIVDNYIQKGKEILEKNKDVREKFVKLLREFLRANFEEKDAILEAKELKEKYENEIRQVDRNWWVFGNVSEELDYPIFMAHAEEIGYKRGIRGEEERPNDLYQIDEYGNIVIDTENPEKILDHLRKVVVWK